MSKIILAHENTDTTTLENPSDNERIIWIVQEKENGEKILFFPQSPKHPPPTSHITELALKHNIPFDDIIWINIKMFDKFFKEGRFTEGPHRETSSSDPRIPGIFNMNRRWQVWGIIDDKLYYSAYPKKGDKP